MEVPKEDAEERKPGVVARLHAALLGENILRDLSLHSLSRTCVGVATGLTVAVFIRLDTVAAIPFALTTLAALMWMWAEHRLAAARQAELRRARATQQITESLCALLESRMGKKEGQS